MKTILHKAHTRGYADNGWLQSRHTFSFARYHDPERIHFGALRVLNDDTIAPGKGFGAHSHENMEIVSIPLDGALRHGDSMGNSSLVAAGQIQVMSAGEGLAHSEFNALEDRPVKFLQIWIFPRIQQLPPRYDYYTLPPARVGELRTILTPDTHRLDGVAWIHQQAWFHTLDLEKQTLDYQLHSRHNGLYVFVLEGQADVCGEPLGRRDGLGLWETVEVTIATKTAAQLLLIEVPCERWK